MPTAREYQDLIHAVIPSLVPKTLALGTFTLISSDSGEGDDFEYSVEEFVTRGVRLEDSWSDMNTSEQGDIMDSLDAALSKLHSLKLKDEHVRSALKIHRS